MGLGQGRLLLSCPPGFHLPTPRGELGQGTGTRAFSSLAPLLWNPTGRGSDLSPRGSCLQNRWAPGWPGEVMVMVMVSCPLLQLNLPSWPS